MNQTSKIVLHVIPLFALHWMHYNHSCFTFIAKEHYLFFITVKVFMPLPFQPIHSKEVKRRITIISGDNNSLLTNMRVVIYVPFTCMHLN